MASPFANLWGAILAPRVRDVEIVAHQCEAALNVQRLRGRRWIRREGDIRFESARILLLTSL